MSDEVDQVLAALNESFPAVSTMTPAQARGLVASRVQSVRNLDDVRSAVDEHVDVGGRSLRLRVYQPHGASPAPRPAVVFLHGGGFVFCSIESHDGFCRAMSRHLDAVVVSVDYRLAPEHKAPAAADDAFLATRWVANNAARLHLDPERLIVAGDSAGGNLAAVTCLQARTAGGPHIAGQVLLYPVIGPEFDNEGHRRFGTGFYNTTENMQWYWEQYLPAAGIPEPVEHVVPSRATTLAGLPPAVVVTPGRDPLMTEGEGYAAALRDAGVDVRHRHYPDLFHGFLTMADLGAAVSARDVLWADIAALLQPDRTAITGRSNQEDAR